MNKFLISTTCLLALLAVAPDVSAAQAFCGTVVCEGPTSGAADIPRAQWDTTFSLGLQWNFGDSRPELVAAVRRTDTTTHDQVLGAQIDATMPLDLANPLQKPVIRALALGGNRGVQGQIGLGVEAISWQALAAVGVQAPYSTAGANIFSNDGVKLYAGVNSFARVVGPHDVQGVATCPSGYALSPATSPFYGFQGVLAAAVKNGQTCYKAAQPG